MSVKNILTEFGLNDKKADVYLACLELGTATATNIAKKAKIKRPYFYDIVDFLIKKGLVKQTIRGKRKLYIAVDPESIKNQMEEKIRELDRVMPELKALYKAEGEKPKVSFYEGTEGLEKIYLDVLNYRGEVVGFSTQRFLTFENEKFSKEYIEKRKQKKIKVRVIGPVSNEFLNLKQHDKEEYRETKLLPIDLYNSDVEIIMFGDKMAIMNYKENFGLVLESNDVAKPLKMIFELIWRGGFIVE